MMITRCPECATAFRVTPEQLAARQGSVRCGHCAAIFDAVAGLESPQEEPLPVDAGDVSESQAKPRKEEAEREAEPLNPAEAIPAAVPEAEIREEPPAEEAREAAEAEEEVISFTRKQRLSPWWTGAAVLLLVALNVQALFYFRGAITLVWPDSKPYIERLCARLGCEVPLPRRAELMSIEASELQADPGNPGIMVLSATLRNRAAFPQAYPALELTLTNDQDQPLARRVLQPADYLAGAGRGAVKEGLASCAGGVPSCELQVKLVFKAESASASGYRLYLFYPS